MCGRGDAREGGRGGRWGWMMKEGRKDEDRRGEEKEEIEVRTCEVRAWGSVKDLGYGGTGRGGAGGCGRPCVGGGAK